MHKDIVLINKRSQCVIIERFTSKFISCQELIRACPNLNESFFQELNMIHTTCFPFLRTIKSPSLRKYNKLNQL